MNAGLFEGAVLPVLRDQIDTVADGLAWNLLL